MYQIMKEITGDVKKLMELGNSALISPLEDLTRHRNTGYGWHNPKLPPEVRRACLSGVPPVIDLQSSIYFLMADWYEQISRTKAPCSFAVYRKWKRTLRFIGPDYDLGSEETELLILAIEMGTCRKREMRNPEAILELLYRAN